MNLNGWRSRPPLATGTDRKHVIDLSEVATDLRQLLSEGERLREAETGYRMALADVAVQAGRYECGEIDGQELADTVGFTARQALGGPQPHGGSHE